MVWLNYPNLLFSFSETLEGVDNSIVNTLIMVPGYSTIINTPKKFPGPPHTLDSLTCIYFYMDDVITEAKGGPGRQCQVFESTTWSIKWLFHFLNN